MNRRVKAKNRQDRKEVTSYGRDGVNTERKRKSNDTVRTVKKGFFIILIVGMSFMLTACAWDLLYQLLGIGCDATSDPHCYQGQAIASSDGSECEKVAAPAQYAQMGSNPPKDKCYLQVAENTGNYDMCAKMKGGYGSYESSECYGKIAVDRSDPIGCSKLSAANQDECYQNVGAKGADADKCAGLSGSAATDCRTGVARGANSEGKTPSCGTGYDWSAGGLGGGSCTKSAAEKTGAETGTKTGAAGTGTKDTTGTTDKGTTPTDKTGTTTPTTDKTGTEKTGTEKSGTTKTPTTDKTGTTPTTDKTGTTDKGTTDKTGTDKTGTDTATTDKGTTDKSTTDKGADKPFWEKILDGISGGTKKIDETAAGAQKTAEDTAQAAADKVKDIFNGVDKNKQPTPDQEKGSRLSDTIKDIEDEDEKAAIVKEFVKEKQKRDAMTLEQQKELIDDIKTKYEDNKRLDDLANTLKKDTIDKVTGKIDKTIEDAKEAAADKIKEEAAGWVKDRLPDSVKNKLDKAQGAYDKAQEKMTALGDKVDAVKGAYDKAKQTYDAVKEVTDKVNKINDKIEQGKIDPGRGRVLKGGVLLGKGLEKATAYIPVFGDTASTVTKETFGVVINVATKKAERSTKLDDCFSDPANCDTDGISGY